jgi:hypothetical protein
MKINWRQDWVVFLGLAVFIVTALLALAQPYGIIPAYLQTGGQGRSSHWIVVAYVTSIAPIFCLSIVNILILSVVQIARVQREYQSTNTLPIGLSFLAIILAGYSSLPLLWIGYEPITSIETPNSKYHLGMRTAIDGDYFWIVSKCDRWNFDCEYRGITGVVNEEKLWPENARLEYNKNTGVLLIRTTERAIPVDGFGKI